MLSEMHFYKISDIEYAFSVKSEANAVTRYYHLAYDDNKNVTINRIRNSMDFFNKNKAIKMAPSSPDYREILTALIDYCDCGIENICFTSQIPETLGFRQSTVKNREIYNAEIVYATPKVPDGALKVVSVRKSKQKMLQPDTSNYYKLDKSDKEFILKGISTNNLISVLRTR